MSDTGRTNGGVVRAAVTVGLLIGYTMVILEARRAQNTTTLVASLILLPSNLAWLWLVR